MIFFPNKIYDNAGEDAVWEGLKNSLRSFDGFALNKANLYFEGKSWFQPDIIVVSPYLGIILIEVKGCKIDDIEQVTLGSWGMNKSFYAEEINPFDQVQKQIIRLNKILNSKGIYLPTNAVRHRVALPFITEDSWKEKGFENEHIDKLIRFSDKTNLALPKPKKPKIPSNVWLDICKTFGVKQLQNADYEPKNEGLLEKPKRSLSNKGKLVCIPYNGYAPNKEAILKHVSQTIESNKINDSYTYLVATAGLERLRGRDNPGCTEQKDRLLFDKAINQLMNKRILKNTDTIILLRRIIDAEFAGNEPRRLQLNTDIYDLYKKILEIDSAGIDLSNKFTRQSVEKHWISQASFNEFAVIKAKLAKALNEHDAHDVSGTSSQAVLQWIENEYVPHPTIIMEGFTRLTPLQKLYIDHCLDFGSTVILVYSYEKKQEWGFQNQNHVISAFNNVTVEALPYSAQPLNIDSDLSTLKEDLFDLKVITDNNVELNDKDHFYTSKDTSVTASEYNFISQEIESVCRSIKSQVSSNATGNKKIAIVTRDLGTYAPQFISKLQNDPKLSQYLDLPQRKLLQTPFGRFILSLYKIWDHDIERLVMDSNTFSDIIASGWLGKALRETLTDLEFIKPLFSHCETLKQWSKVLKNYYDVNSEETSRFPLASLNNRVVLFKQWLDALEHLDIVCARLFSKESGNHDIAQHISLLGEELERFVEDNPFADTELELLEQLKDVFKGLEKTDSITLTHQEFGSIINSMTSTEEQMTGEHAHDKSWEHDKTQIKIVMPESIDGLMTNGSDGYDIIYYVGGDNQRLPKKTTQDWLFNSKKLLGDLEVNDSNKFERYLFLSVFRCAKEQFHLSYSRYDGSQSNGKSTYYMLLAKRLMPKSMVTSDYKHAPWDWKMKARIKPYDVLKSVSVAEMMVFNVCPYRFLLEKASNRARCFKTEWQLTLYSGSQWKEGILYEAVKSDKILETKSINSLKDKVWRENIAPYYPYISNLEVGTRESYLGLPQIAGYTKITFDMRSKNKIFDEGFNLQVPVMQLFWGKKTVSGSNVENNSFFETVITNELLLPVSKDSEDEKDQAQVHAQQLLHHVNQKVKSNMSSENEAFFKDQILNMSQHPFEKQPGNHCKLCPSNKLCLSVNSED